MIKQPVHTVAGGAHLFRRDTAAKLGRIAGRYLDRYAPDPAALRETLGTRVPPGTAEAVHRRVRVKLEREPVECFLIDFEDGFGTRSEAEEDDAAATAAREVAAGVAAGSLPPSLGIRIKSLDEVTGERALRTLELFLAAYARTRRDLPDGFTVLLPKIIAAAQVERLSEVLTRLETTLGLPEEEVAIDLMIETPQSLVAPDGRIAVPELVAAAGGRCRTVHLGAYDLTGAVAVAAEDQTLGHPLCDVARQLLQLSLAGTGVRLSDGATNVLPVEPHRGETALSPAERAENMAVVHRAWRLHYSDVRRSLSQGFYQSWDLHPAQLVSRFAAVFSFFLEGLDAAASRLDRFVTAAGQAVLTGSVFDDEASGQGLLNFFHRGLASGALTPEEAARSGLTAAELETRSFRAILERRRG
ncbi:MAG: phosphoenolpyruvate kinase [Gemmatimonadales bacterium]|nr:phosphoenolpyruvate kinase [Candidatus Palauibacter irciniicola]MYC19262.1 phosphoenolpyruvate kinase [Gemmatimonadales bacterium]